MNTNPETFNYGISIGLVLGMSFMFFQDSKIKGLQAQIDTLTVKVMEHKEMQESRNRFILRRLK